MKKPAIAAVVMPPDKDANGRFAKGNKLGWISQGRATWSQAGRKVVFRRMMLKAIEIAEKSKDDGHRLRAIELVCAYAVGKPKQNISLDINGDGNAPLVQIVLDRLNQDRQSECLPPAEILPMAIEAATSDEPASEVKELFKV